MSLVVPNVGDLQSLAYLTGKTGNGNLKLHLFVNNVTPGKTDVLGTYTECSAAGYAVATLTGSSWTIATVSSTTTASYAATTFTMTAACTCYGYFVTDAGGTNLLWSEAFPSVFNITSDGGSVTVTPSIVAN